MTFLRTNLSNREKSIGLLFTLWLLLIPLPLFNPIYRLDYEPYYYQFSSFSLYPNQLVALLLAGSAFAFYWRKIDLRPRLVTLPLILLCLLTLLTAPWAIVSGSLAIVMFVRMSIALVLFFALKTVPISLQTLLRALLLFLAVQGILATVQYVIQDDLGLRWLGEFDLRAEPGGGSIIFGRDEYWLRSYGLTPHPNILGGFVASALAAALFLWDETAPAVRRWQFVGSIFFGTMALLLTFSRSAWLGAAAACTFALGFQLLNSLAPQKRTPKLTSHTLMRTIASQLIPIAFAVGLFVMLAWPALQARFRPLPNQTVTQSVGERQLLHNLAFEIIGDRPIFGIGAGNFGPVMLDHPDRETFPNIHPVHNVPLLLWAELGVLGGLSWLTLMLIPAVFVLSAWRNGRLTPWLLGTAAALLALAVVDLFDYYSWGWPHGLTWRWMWFGLLANHQINRPPLEPDPDLPAVSPARG